MFTGRVVGPGEPQWLPEDIDLALAWQAYENSLCSGCSQPLAETSNPDNARHYQAHETHCQGCAVIEWRREKLQDEDRDLAGLRLYVTKGARRG